MTKEEILKMLNAHPVMYVATNDNGQPRVRGILMYKADDSGIVFHTGTTKDFYRQLVADPRAHRNDKGFLPPTCCRPSRRGVLCLRKISG